MATNAVKLAKAAADSYVITATATQTLTNKTIANGIFTGIATANTVAVSNNVTITGTLSCNSATINSANGSFYNINSVDTNSLNFNTGTSSDTQLKIIDRPGADVYIQAQGGVGAVSRPSIGAVAAGVNGSGFNIFNTGGNHIRFQTNGNGIDEQFGVAHTAYAVNYLQATGAATGGASPTLSAQGSDANITLGLASKGTSAVAAITNGTVQFDVYGPANAVNRIRMAGTAAGNNPVISAQGSDTNIGLRLYPKGTATVDAYNDTNSIVKSIGNSGYGAFQAKSSSGNAYFFGYSGASEVGRITFGSSNNVGFATSSAANTQFVIAHTANAVNYIQATGSSTSNWASFSTQGADTDITMSLVAKGAGSIVFGTAGASSNRQFQISHTASAVNYLQATGSATGSPVAFSAQGSDTNVRLNIFSKGTESVDILTGGGAVRQAKFTHTASTVNYIQFTGGATGNSVELTAQGSDTNIRANFYAKGTGNVVLGNGTGITFVAGASVGGANYLQATGVGSASAPNLSAQGSDTNIDLSLVPKGNGVVKLATSSPLGANTGDSQDIFVAYGTNNNTNYLKATMIRNSSGVNWTTATTRFGLSTDSTQQAYIDFNPVNNNYGLSLNATSTSPIQFITGGGAEQFRVAHTASAVNYIQVTGGATGGDPAIRVQGSDATRGLQISSKGSSFVYLQNGGTVNQFSAGGTTSAVNYLNARGSATGGPPQLESVGADTNISLALQTKGTGALDLIAGANGVNISNGTSVTAITRSASGSNYTTAPAVVISAPTQSGGVQAVANCTIGFPFASIVSGGTGYSVNDVLTISGGTFTSAGYLTVTSVSGGIVTGVSIGGGYGAYTVAPTNPVSVTGGTGAGATFNLTGWTVNPTFTITNAGSGYIEQPTVSFSGGGGSGAAAYARVGGVVTFTSLGTTLNLATENGIGFRVLTSSSVSTDMWQAISSGSLAILRSSSSTADAQIHTGGTGALSIGTNAGITQLKVLHTASAVNHIQATGSATAGQPIISAQGSDTDITMNFSSKNAGSLIFNTNGKEAFRVANGGTSVVNNIQVVGNAAGFAPYFQSRGSDTNIDLSLVPKGTGSVTTTATLKAGLISGGTF